MNKLIKHRNDINKIKHHKKLQQSRETEGTEEENHTAIVYGRLPPEVRKQQARYFNENRLPYLVATDAIGMGLNLNIKKVVFMDHEKSTKDGFNDELEEH
jgi:superfamily II DNA/RNA helicase